jgi:hypothetical protein
MEAQKSLPWVTLVQSSRRNPCAIKVRGFPLSLAIRWLEI